MINEKVFDDYLMSIFFRFLYNEFGLTGIDDIKNDYQFKEDDLKNLISSLSPVSKLLVSYYEKLSKEHLKIQHIE